MTEDSIKVGTVRNPHTDGIYTLYQCGQCKSSFFNATDHPIDLGFFYNDIAEDREHVNQRFIPSKYWMHEDRKVIKFYGSMPKSVLDVGFRAGDCLMHWPQQVMRVGVEISSTAAATAEARGISVIQKPLEQVEFDKRFDVVTCFAVMEHLQEPMRCLESLEPKLLDRRYTPGGNFSPFSSIPVLRSLWRRFMWYVDTYTPVNRIPVFDYMCSYYQRRI